MEKAPDYFAGRVVGGPRDGEWVVNESPWLRTPVIEATPPQWQADRAARPHIDTYIYVFVDSDNTWRLQ